MDNIDSCNSETDLKKCMLEIEDLKYKNESLEREINYLKNNITVLEGRLEHRTGLIEDRINWKTDHLESEIERRFKISQKEERILGKDFAGWARLFGVIVMGVATSFIVAAAFREMYNLVFGG